MVEFLATETQIRNAVSANSEPANWIWTENQRGHWRPALEWQEFANRWRNVKEEVLHPDTNVLDLRPVPGFIEVNHLLIRECYEEAEKLVWRQAVQRPKTGVIITGQPGIGKTVFIWYLLVCLLQKKQVVLFHAPGTISLLFHHDGTYAAPREVEAAALPTPSADSTSPPFIWSLFDLDEGEKPPQITTVPRSCFPVQAPSPNQSRYKTWRKQRSPIFTGFPLWTQEELGRCASLDDELPKFKRYLDYVTKHWEDVAEISPYPGTSDFLKATHGKDAPKSADEAFNILLDALITRFGPIPRDVFYAMYDVRGQEERHESALSIRIEELRKVVWELTANKHFPHTTSSHCVISVNHDRKVGDVMAWRLDFKSKYIGKRVSDRLFTESENEVRSLIAYFFSVPQAKGLAGYLFEPFVHRAIAAGPADADGGSWPLREMSLQRRSNSKAPSFVLNDSAATVDGFSKIKRTQVVFNSKNLPENLANDEYYVASVSNLPFFNSFLVDFDFSVRSADLWVLQMTTAADHRGSARGYQVIHEIMGKVKEQLKKGEYSAQPPPAKKSKKSKVKLSVNVHYVLVRPGGEGPSTWKLPEGWNDATTWNNHRGNGYVLDHLENQPPRVLENIS